MFRPTGFRVECRHETVCIENGGSTWTYRDNQEPAAVIDVPTYAMASLLSDPDAGTCVHRAAHKLMQACTESVVPRAIVSVADAESRTIIESFFTSLGWEVTTADDGASFEGAQITGDVALFDLDAGASKALQLMRQLSKFESPPVIIAVSSAVDLPTTLEAARAGACDVLSKPVDLDRLREVISEMNLERTRESGIIQSSEALGIDVIPEFIGVSPQSALLRTQIQQISRFPSIPVLILGETGTGKEVVAAAIHRLSGGGPWVPVNCASVPSELFESELFGHEPGAYTGARSRRIGLFEEAAHGTLFLDEIAEMPPSLQAKLLRALETQRFRRLGSEHDTLCHARVLSATNRTRVGAEGEGALRTDLFYRLAGYVVRIPPLRERPEDIPVLAQHFLDEFVAINSCRARHISSEALTLFALHRWPGNVRCLRGVVRQCAIQASTARVSARDAAQVLENQPALSAETPASAEAEALPNAPAIRKLERQLLVDTYRRFGNIAAAARQLDMPRTTLRERLRRYGVLNKPA